MEQKFQRKSKMFQQRLLSQLRNTKQMKTVDTALEAVVTKVPEQYGHKEVQMSLLDQYMVAPEMLNRSM